jgi:LysM repeat protein
LAFLFSVLLLLIAEVASAHPGTYTVRKGDTLTSIAKKYGVKVSQLRRWNGLRRDRIQPGDELHLRANDSTRSYRVKKGDTLGRIAKRIGVSVDEILDVNPGLGTRDIKIGQVIALPGGKAGSADDDGPAPPKPSLCSDELIPLPKHPYYRLRSKAASWARPQTVAVLRRGFDEVRSRHKLAPAVHIHDASQKSGGELGEHRSHQDGRDVDIAYYQRRCPKNGCPVRVVDPEDLDVVRQWTLISQWLRSGQIEALFIDHRLQKVLYEHAKRRGVRADQLREWFQYPDPPTSKNGVIRHWDSHRNHIHARIKPSRCQ